VDRFDTSRCADRGPPRVLLDQISMGMRTSCPPHLLYEKRHGHPKIFPSTCSVVSPMRHFLWSYSPGRIVPLPRWTKRDKKALVGSVHTTSPSQMVNGPWATLSFAPLSFHIRGIAIFYNGLRISLLFPEHDHPSRPLLFSFFLYFSGQPLPPSNPPAR